MEKKLKKVQASIPEAVHKRITRIAKEQHSTVRNVVEHALITALEYPEMFDDVPRDGRLSGRLSGREAI